MLGIKLHATSDQIVDDDLLSVVVDPQPDRGPAAFGEKASPLLVTEIPAAPGIPVGAVLRLRRLPLGLKFLRRAIAMIGGAACQQLLRVLLVQVAPFGLPVRTVRPAHIGALLPVDAQPPEIFQNRLLVLYRRAGAVGVLDTEEERPALATREEPVEERHPRAADMQVPSRTGRVSSANRHVKSMLTDWLRWIRRMASASSGAADRTVIFDNWFGGATGIVLVTMTSRIS